MISAKSGIFCTVALLAFTGSAVATTRSSFLTVDAISGVTITQNANNYTVALNPGATFTLGVNTFNITDLFGFYFLSDTADFSPLVSLAPFGNFTDDSTNSGPGGAQGWRSNPNQGITPGNSQLFTIPGNFDLDHVDRFGFHVRLDGTFPGTQGNTGNITLVPTPGACALIGLGGLICARRRR